MHRMAGGALVGDDLAVIQGIGSDTEVSSSRSYRWMPSMSWKGGGKSRGFGGDGADGSQPMLVLEKAGSKTICQTWFCLPFRPATIAVSQWNLAH